MASWDLHYSVYFNKNPKNKDLLEKLSTIMENKDKLCYADKLRKLWGDKKLSELSEISGVDLSDDDSVTSAFGGLDYDWDDFEIKEDQLHFNCDLDGEDE